ncbi:MAG: zinc-binding dehydrogenase [Sphingopyxis sp.]
MRTIGLASASKLDFVLQNGADHAVDRSRADLVDHVRSIVGDAGVALSLNSAAGATIIDDLQLLGNFGQLISFGHLGGLPEGSAADLLMPYFNKSIGIRVSDLYTLWGSDKARFSQMLGAVARDLAAGKIDPNLHAVVPARSAMDAHHYFDRQDALGKIVLKSEW